MAREVRPGCGEWALATRMPATASAIWALGATCESRRPTRPASRWRKAAWGQERTTSPASSARHPKSTPSRYSGIAGSSPPSCRHAANRMNMPAVEPPSTGPASSWCWSMSPDSTLGTRAPLGAMDSPRALIWSAWLRSRGCSSFGTRTSGAGMPSGGFAARRRLSRAPCSGSRSSCSSHSHCGAFPPPCDGASRSRARRTDAPNPTSPGPL
ncbi:hypothetical protein MAJHIDBO_02227 [Propionibacterium freudenreichii subsp. shermanii]|nr:hypothetical protein MAJHIDBO_02227 [Propionibacterium freudenreichii subsp. shermanii]SPS10008.1 hypothetical protein MAJHIDBO_02227 [Propionibacterium freudenreichii subsp. shermanii]